MPTASRLVWEPRDGRLARRPDELAVEEPLEIRIAGREAEPPTVLTVTMRTPGHDFELAAGFLLAEGVIDTPGELRGVRYCTDPELDGEQRYNVVTVDLAPGAASRFFSSGRSGRLTVTSSSCGLCGSASIEALTQAGLVPVPDGARFRLASVLSWPERLRDEGQAGFAATGGLHAAALVSADGSLLVAREDIGRHNAVDKVAGWALAEATAGRLELPAATAGLVVSGRTSFEILEKAVRLGVPVVAAVSAASSLAVKTAEEFGISLLGFVRAGHCTVYSHPERLEES